MKPAWKVGCIVTDAQLIWTANVKRVTKAMNVAVGTALPPELHR